MLKNPPGMGFDLMTGTEILLPAFQRKLLKSFQQVSWPLRHITDTCWKKILLRNHLYQP